MSCNSCNDTYQKMILKGKSDKIVVGKKSENCPSCQASPRFKTFRICFEQRVLPLFSRQKKERSALLISATMRWEQDIVRPHVGTIISTALYGDYGEGTIPADLRNLQQFHSHQFDFVHACGVLDFIFEIDDVLDSVFRVLKPNGLFLFHILPHRLVKGSDPPVIKGSKKERYYPEGVELPSVVFGKKDLLRRMKMHGFKADKFKINDIFSDQVCTWFLGRKPGN